MIDLTFPDHSVDPLTALQSIYKTFKQFIQKVRYKYPDIAFVRTIEIHQSGFPHLHMIVDKYIPVAFIQKCWHDQGGGHVSIHAKKSHGKKSYSFSHKDAAHYLTDEIEKASQDPHKLGSVFWQAGCKTITHSKNLKLLQSDKEWSFVSVTRDYTQAYSHFQYMQMQAAWSNSTPPSIHFGHDTVKFGFGFSHQPKLLEENSYGKNPLNITQG
jgi:hypothetical protein